MDFLTWFLVLVVLPVSVGVASYVYLQRGSGAREEKARRQVKELIDAYEQAERNPQGISSFEPGDMLALGAFGKTTEHLLIVRVYNLNEPQHCQVLHVQSLRDYNEQLYTALSVCDFLKHSNASLIRDGVKVVKYENYPYRERG